MTSKKQDLSRREFIKNSAALSALPIIAGCSGEQPLSSTIQSGGSTGPQSSGTQLDPLPKQRLGKTELMVSALGMGGGSQFNANPDGQWELLLERALEHGMNLFDTADQYGQSEDRYGIFFEGMRDQVYISTKYSSRSLSSAQNAFDNSLTSLKTDYVDIYLLHDVASSEDFTNLADNLWPWMNELKSSGAARFIGFSSMSSASSSQRFIEELNPDVCILAMNMSGYGSFVTGPLVAARERDVGVIAMKTVGGLANNFTLEEIFGWVLSQDGVTAAVVGHAGGAPMLDENAEAVKTVIGATSVKPDYAALEERAKAFAGPHALCWARPDYRDDGNPDTYWWA